MTLIAFATYGTDRIEFITDSARYTRRVSEMGRTTKHLTINHLDAAVLTQGDSSFGDTVKSSCLKAAEDLGTFDAMTDTAPDWLAHLRKLCVDAGETPEEDESNVFLLGWSDRASKFVAYAFPSAAGFEPSKINGLWAMPAPWAMRPSALELDHIKRNFADDEHLDRIVDSWSKKPTRPAPRSTEEWVALACEAREQRALNAGFAHVIVAGDVFHTKLKRGSVETRRVHTFNDSGEEFLSLVEYTEHPIALAGPCWCESGRTYGDCHAREFPCGCRSGKSFGECCMMRQPTG